MTRSTSIILLLMVALLLGTLASIHAQSQPASALLPISLDNAPGPYNPNQPQEERTVRRGA